ncbi:MAG: hypothetical protein EBR55_08835 [Chitinophagia bacterium]|nr:hypothetical protein [Chitinophagia bacterium]
MKTYMVLLISYLILLLALILSSCGSGKYEDARHESDIELIAEKDSVKVYRIINNGDFIYFTNKGGVAK